jgi:hypothetical protein
MLVFSAASYVVLATHVALAATFKGLPATKGATTGPHHTNRKYARLAAAPLSALLVCLVASSSALAHQNGYEADANHDGYIQVYRTGTFHGDWKAYREKANAQLRRHTDEPLIKMVSSKGRAELWVHKTNRLSGCYGEAHSYKSLSTVDEVMISPQCERGFKTRALFSHEVGHVYGLPAGTPGIDPPKVSHHPCTPYWQKRSVNVDARQEPGDTRHLGCPVKIVGFGIHDLHTLAKPG